MFKNYNSATGCLINSVKQRIDADLGSPPANSVQSVFRSWILGFVLLLTIAAGHRSWAQSSANYAFATGTTGSLVLDSNGNTVDMSTGTTTLVVGSVDQTVSALSNIGFSYPFMGNLFTQYTVSANGMLQLGSTALTTTTYAVTGGTAASPKFSAFGGDLQTGSLGKVHCKLVGTAPNRCLVVEYLNMNLYYVSTVFGNDATFQVRLYETGKVEYVYGTVSVSNASGSGVGDVTPSIGFSAGTLANTFAYVLYGSHSSSTSGSFTDNPTSTVGVVTALNSPTEGQRRTYTFTPAQTAAPSGLNFTAVTGASMTLNWTDNSADETGFVVARSTDNVNFTNVAALAANAVSYNATGLGVATTYYWRVYSAREILSDPATGSQATPAGVLSGIKTVGTGGDYTNLTSAFAAINASGLSGNIELQLITGYPATAETYPIASSVAGAAGSYTVKVYPTVSGLSITSANATGTLNLNNAGNIIIDGRVNETGPMDLVISNTNAGASPAISFVNDASNNIIRYCSIRSSNNSTTSGTIVFGATTGITGNDSNTIANCDIREGSANPANGIYSAGTTTTAALYNDNNIVSNCNIYNYFSATLATNGILVAAGNAGWNISGNSFYQTASRTYTTANTHGAITVSNSSLGSGYTIANNFVGGTQPNAGGTPYTMLGAVANLFRGITLSAGIASTSNVQGNTITNIAFTTTSGTTTLPGFFNGINIGAGQVNVGTTSGNIIGAASGNNAIVVTSTTSGGYVSGIYATSAGILDIQNNRVAAISTAGAVGIGYQLYGIYTAGAPAQRTISGNTIGSATANANTVGIAGTTATCTFMGIYEAGSPTTLTMSNNIVRGNTLMSAADIFYGLRASTSQYTVSSNEVYDNNITSSTASTTSSTMYGFYDGSSPTLENFTNNQIYNLSMSLNTTGAANVMGGVYSTTTAGTKNWSGNSIYGFSFANSNTGASTVYGIRTSLSSPNIFKNKVYGLTNNAANGIVYGISVDSGTTATVYNNLIGNLTAPNSTLTAPAVSVAGLNIVGGTTVNAYNNTVRISGTGGTNFGTAAVFVNATPGTVNLRNNIFVNSATPSGTGKAVAFQKSSAVLTNYAATSNKNVFYAGTPSANNLIFFDATNSDQNLADFKTRMVTRDQNSYSESPVFVSTTGTDATFLHIDFATPTFIEGGADVIAAVTDDFDGDLRNVSTPDIGADEFAGTAIGCLTADGGTAFASVTTICVSGTSVVSASGYSAGSGTTYQWQSSTTLDFAVATDIGSASSGYSNLTTPTLTSDIYYRLKVVCVNGPLTAYSTTIHITVTNPTILTTTPATRCGAGTVVLSATAPVGQTMNWYAAASGGPSLFTGANFTTPTIAATTNFYVGSSVDGGTENAGRLSSPGTDGNTLFTNYGIVFNALNELVINTAMIYPVGTGTVTVALQNSLGVEIATSTPIAVTGTGIATPVNLPLGFNVPTGTGYRLVIKATTGITGMIRDFASTFPYNSPNVSVTGGWTGSASTASYFLYNLNVSTGCSGTRSAVTATVNTAPALTLSSNAVSACSGVSTSLVTVTSTIGDYDNYVWNPATNVSGNQNDGYTFNPTSTTVYTLTAFQTGGGQCQNTATVTVTVNPLPTFASVVATPSAVCANNVSTLVATLPAGFVFSGSTSTYTPISGTATTAVGDDFAQGNLPIGFTFNYRGSSFTTFAAASNGFIELGSALSYINNTEAGWVPSTNALATRANIIAPFWDDNNTVGGSLQYLTTGSAPNRILTVQWTDMHVGSTGSTTSPTLSMQLVLHEADGSFDFKYGPVSGVLTATASIGSSGIVGQYSSVTPTTAPTATVSNSAENTTATAVNMPSGTVYSFAVPSQVVTWTPTSGLYTDLATTIAYGGENLKTVYAKVAGPTTFYAHTTGLNGCESAPAPVSLTVNPLPSAPTGTNSSQCGSKVPTASVADTNAFTTPTFKWYADNVTTTALQTSTSTTYTSVVSTDTTFYVSVVHPTTGCESLRTAVMVMITPADAVTLTPSATSGCLGDDFTLNASSINPDYVYGWTASPEAGSGITGSVAGNSVNFTPTVAGTYTYTLTGVDGSCSDVDTVIITINALPNVSASTSATNFCQGGSATLTANIVQAGLVTQGAGAITSATYSNPFYSLWSNTHTQHLITAAELAASGLAAGNITSVALDVTVAGTLPMLNLSVKIGSTNATSMTAFSNNAGFSTVYTNASLMPTTGMNTLTFSAPFYWDGASNLVLEFCHGNPASSATMSRTVRADNTSYVSSIKTHVSSATAAATICGDTSSNLLSYSVRPKFTFAGQALVASPDVTYSWSPGALTGSSVMVTPAATTLYTVTATNTTTGCSNTATVNVLVKPQPLAPTTSDSSHCGTQVATASVADNNAFVSPTFKWYADNVTLTALQATTSNTYNTPVSTTTTFYVSVVNPTTLCESLRTQVTVTVSAADAVIITPAATSVCLNTSVNLSASSSNGTYTYTWTANPQVGSGITTPVVSNALSVVPTIAGTYTYTVSASGSGCQTSTDIIITVNPNPVVIVNASPATVCTGGSSTLTAMVTSQGNAAVGAGATTSGTYSNPFYSAWSNTHTQHLITAAELTAAGISAGNINSVALNVTIAGTLPMINLSVKIGASNAAAMAAFANNAGFTTVYTNASMMPVTGMNVLPFSTPFNWDGVSNIVLEFCHGNPSSSATMTRTVAADNTSFVSSVKAHVSAATSAATVCGDTTTNLTSYSVRPQFTFNAQIPSNGAGVVDWVWMPGNLTGNSINVMPASTTEYTVTATNIATGCNTSSDVTVTVQSGVAITTDPADSIKCVGETATFTVVATGSGLTYQWYKGVDPIVGNASATTNTLSLTAVPFSDNGSIYHVVVTSSCATTATSANATLTVNPTPTVTSPGAQGFCADAVTAEIPLVGTPSGVTFNISGGAAIGLANQTGVTAIPSFTAIAGSATVSLTPVANGCTGLAVTFVVTVNPLPATPTTGPSAAVCEGTPLALTSSTVVIPGYSMNSNSGVAFVDINATGTLLPTPVISDDSEHNITIPSFTFNGVAYTTARVGLNGIIVFGSTTGEIGITNATLPTTSIAAGNIFMAPYWDDLDINMGGTVKTQTVGNVFIIQYTGIDHNLYTTGNITFQVQLNLTTGAINYVYQDVVFGSPTYDGGITAGIGLQLNSTTAVNYSNNTASLVNGQSITFTPNTASYSWTGPNGFASNLQNPTVTSSTTAADAGTYVLTVTNVATGCQTIVNRVVTTTPNAMGGTVPNQAICGGSTPADFVLTGSSGTITKWQKASDMAFTSPVDIANTTTTLTGAEVGVVLTTTYVRAVLQGCSIVYSDVATVTASSTTWMSGAWSNGVPDSTTAAIIASNYSSTGDLTACNLIVNNSAVVTVNTGHDFNIGGDVTVAVGASLTFENNANLLQDPLATANNNSGNIVSKRSATMRRLDYVYWGSPVSGQDLKVFSPYTVSPTNVQDIPTPVGLSRFYTLNETNNSFAVIAEPLGVNFDAAKGYMLRAPNNFPSNGSPSTFNGAFRGVPHNGDYSIAITNTPVTGSGFNMLGNPYPSPINATQFLATNPGTLYFWTHQTQDGTSSSYSTFNSMGATNPANGPLAPNGFIQTGQGFLLQTAASGTASFTNAMRSGDNQGQFFRTENVEKHRFWLSLSKADVPMINQILVGYMQGATQGFDVSVDGLLNHTGNSIASTIGDGRYAIQGRSLPFNASDVVPMAFKAETEGTYTISLDQFDGLFEGDQTIFIKDNLTGAEQNLKTGAYSFATIAGSFSDRFQIIFQTTLGVENPGLDANTIVVYKDNGMFHINAGTTTMSSVKVFDIRGRMIYEKDGINATTTSLNNMRAEQQVLLVQITSDTNKVVTKKVIN